MPKTDREALASDILALTAELVAVDSVMGKEGPCARVLMSYFDGRGVPARLQEVQPERWNVLAGSEAPRLLLNGHMDMVDTVEGWSTRDPYRLEMVDGDMVGSGVGNMKAGLAAMAVATANAWDRDAREVLFVAVVGECSELGLGTKHFLAHGGGADLAIVGEPTSLMAQTAHTGTYQALVRFFGVPFHTGESERGVNAVEAAAEFVLAIKRAKLSTKTGAGPFEGAPRALAGRMSGGFYAQITAPEASVWVDVRIPKGIDEAQISQAVDRVAAEAAETVSARWERTTLAFEPAYVMSAGAKPGMDALSRSYERVSGSELGHGFSTPANRFFATDAAHLEAAGVPSIVFGPGRWEVGPDEAVSLDEAVLYAAILSNFATTVAREGFGV